MERQLLAISRNRESVFLFAPENGIRIPVLLNIKKGEVSISMPSVDELRIDYIHVDNLDKLRAELHGKKMLLDNVIRFVTDVSKALGHSMDLETSSIKAIRKATLEYREKSIAEAKRKRAERVKALRRSGGASMKKRARISGKQKTHVTRASPKAVAEKFELAN